MSGWPTCPAVAAAASHLGRFFPPASHTACSAICLPPLPQAALRALLDDPAVDGCATDQLHRIKFLSLRNLAELLARRGAEAAPEALAVYCQATQVGLGDRTAWGERETVVWGKGVARSVFAVPMLPAAFLRTMCCSLGTPQLPQPHRHRL